MNALAEKREEDLQTAPTLNYIWIFHRDPNLAIEIPWRNYLFIEWICQFFIFFTKKDAPYFFPIYLFINTISIKVQIMFVLSIFQENNIQSSSKEGEWFGFFYGIL